MTETLLSIPVMLAAQSAAPLWAILLMGGIIIALIILLHKELWEFFVKLEVGIILLIVLTVLSLFGGILPQHLTEADVALKILEVPTPALVEVDKAAELMGILAPASISTSEAASKMDLPAPSTISEEDAVKLMGAAVPEGESLTQAYSRWLISEYAISILETYQLNWFPDKVKELPQPTRSFYKYGFFMIYHTWYYLLLAYLLFANVVCCSIRRISSYIKLRHREPPAFTSEMLKSQNEFEEFPLDVGPEADVDKAIEALAAEGLNAHKCKKDSAGYQLSLDFGFKIPHTLTSVLYHLALFIGLIGLLNTSYYKWEDDVSLQVGEVKEIHHFTKNTKMYEVLQGWYQDYGWEWANPDKRFDLEKTFQVRCDDYWTEYVPHNGWYGVKDYVSILSVIEDNEEVITEQHVEVNYPLVYKGIDFYQTGVDLIGTLIITPPRGEPIPVTTTIWGTQIPYIPGLSVSLAGSTYVSGKLVNEDGTITEGFGPLLRVGKIIPEVPKDWPDKPVEKEGEKKRPKYEVDWMFTVEVGKPVEWKGYTFELTEPYIVGTGLQVVRDPGVPVLWVAVFGILIMMALRVYFPIYRTRIDVTPVTGLGNKLVIAGRTYGLSANFRKQAERIEKILKKVEK